MRRKNKAKESGALTIMLGKNNDVYYYEGQLLPDGSNFKSATFATIREEIINKKKEVIKTHVHDVIVLRSWAENKGDKKFVFRQGFCSGY